MIMFPDEITPVSYMQTYGYDPSFVITLLGTYIKLDLDTINAYNSLYRMSLRPIGK